MYRKEFHARVNTDNFTESFNNVLKNHYLTLRHDKSVYSLTKIILHCVFPDQEREYVILTARQSSAHRQSRTILPHFLLNRPAHVQNSCLSNIEKGKRISSVSISEVSSKDGIFKVMSSKGDYEVSIIIEVAVRVHTFPKKGFRVNTCLGSSKIIHGAGKTSQAR